MLSNNLRKIILGYDIETSREISSERSALATDLFTIHLFTILKQELEKKDLPAEYDFTYGLRVAVELSGNTSRARTQAEYLARNYNTLTEDRGQHIDAIPLYEGDKQKGRIQIGGQ